MDQTKLNELTLKLDRARWWLLDQQPFYGQLTMGLQDRILEPGHPVVNTAATNGKSIYWNAAFLGALNDEETRFVLMHEASHCAFGHIWRFPEPSNRANSACDHAINLTLLGVSGVSMPKVGLADPQYRGMAEEEIFAKLPEDPQQDGCGLFGKGIGDDEGDGDTPGDGGQEDSLKDQWERRLIQAAQAAKASGQGDIPGEMERALAEALHTRVDWKQELADFVRTAVSTRNDWSRAARRHAHQPVIYPRKQRNELGTVVFVRDTSGSIDDTIIAEFNALIDQCLGETNCSGLVIDCDAEIHAEHRINPGESCPPKALGGGGTDLRPPFDRVTALTEDGTETVAGLIYLTDLMGPMPESVDFPTLWLCTTELVASTGRTVRIE